MLSRYDGKKLRVTTASGEVFSGEAAAFPAGYGLHEFGVEEESLAFGDVQVFLSEIARIELLPLHPAQRESGDYSAQVEALFLAPCRIADILPRRVGKDAPGQAFAVERYFRGGDRRAGLYRRYAEILLRLSCYESVAVSFDGGESWERDPEPEGFAGRLAQLESGYMRAIFPDKQTMLEIDAPDTQLAVWSLDTEWLETICVLCRAEGLFFREAEEGE